jgi:hypothetical protein
MTDVLVYDKDYRLKQAPGGAPRWHSNHRVFADLLAGDRLWVVTSGKCLGREDEGAGYLVAVWPLAQVTPNPDDDPAYPARRYQHRILVNEAEAIHLDEPVCVDPVVRGKGFDKTIPVGRFLRGPRRMSDERVRQLLAAAGAEMARKWLTASKSKPGDSNSPVQQE